MCKSSSQKFAFVQSNRPPFHASIGLAGIDIDGAKIGSSRGRKNQITVIIASIIVWWIAIIILNGPQENAITLIKWPMDYLQTQDLLYFLNHSTDHDAVINQELDATVDIISKSWLSTPTSTIPESSQVLHHHSLFTSQIHTCSTHGIMDPT